MNLQTLKWAAERAEATPSGQTIRIEVLPLGLRIRGYTRSYITSQKAMQDRFISWVELDSLEEEHLRLVIEGIMDNISSSLTKMLGDAFNGTL